MGFELFSKAEHIPELEETFSKLARSRVGDLNTEYQERLARVLRSLQKKGEVGGAPQGPNDEEISYILVRAAEGVKHDAKVQGDRQALQQHLRKLATLAIAAMKN